MKLCDMNNQTNILDAGSIAASTKRYRVTSPHSHDTLKSGDVVVAIETPNHHNYLYRESDATVHAVKDDAGQYVHLEEVHDAIDPSLIEGVLLEILTNAKRFRAALAERDKLKSGLIKAGLIKPDKSAA